MIITIILVQLYIHKFYSYLHHLFLIFNKFESMKQYLSLQYEAVMVIALLEYLFVKVWIITKNNQQHWLY